jgi:hypothetical protein
MILGVLIARIAHVKFGKISKTASIRERESPVMPVTDAENI